MMMGEGALSFFLFLALDKKEIKEKKVERKKGRREFCF